MTPAAFRKLALSLPEAVESSHMNHPDFRVSGKIFATLYQRNTSECAMVKLTPDEQRAFLDAAPAMFSAVPGAWGARGCTEISLRQARTAPIRAALLAAWKNAAPKRLLD